MMPGLLKDEILRFTQDNKRVSVPYPRVPSTDFDVASPVGEGKCKVSGRSLGLPRPQGARGSGCEGDIRRGDRPVALTPGYSFSNRFRLLVISSAEAGLLI